MRQSFIEVRDDLEWLRDVHGIDIENVAVAVVWGNEDAPSKVETYAENHVDCKPRVYLADNDGNLRLNLGE